MECSFAMKGSALTWWLGWYLANPKRSWDSFTCALLWHFKPEWRPILPIEGEEEATEVEPTEKDEEKETEFTISVEEEESTAEENIVFIASDEKPTAVEEPKMFVIGSEFLSMTNQNLGIVEKEHKKEKEQEFKTDHDSLSPFLCPKPPPTQFPSTLPAPAPPLKPPDPPPKPPDLLMVHSAHPPLESPDLKLLSEIALAPSPPAMLSLKPTNGSFKASPELELHVPPPPPKPPDLKSPSHTLFSLPPAPPQSPTPPPLPSSETSFTTALLRPPPKPPDIKPPIVFLREKEVVVFSGTICLPPILQLLNPCDIGQVVATLFLTHYPLFHSHSLITLYSHFFFLNHNLCTKARDAHCSIKH
jgi:hypothetical protein